MFVSVFCRSSTSHCEVVLHCSSAATDRHPPATAQSTGRVFYETLLDKTLATSSCETVRRCRWFAASGLGLGVIDDLKSHVELELVMLSDAAVFSASVGENSQYPNSLILEERNDFVIEHIGSYERIFAII